MMTLLTTNAPATGIAVPVTALAMSTGWTVKSLTYSQPLDACDSQTAPDLSMRIEAVSDGSLSNMSASPVYYPWVTGGGGAAMLLRVGQPTAQENASDAVAVQGHLEKIATRVTLLGQWESTATVVCRVPATSASTSINVRFWADDASLTPGQRLARILQERQAPFAPRRRAGLPATGDFRELRARETLALVLGAGRFRRFIRDGFVTVRGRSGDVYQLFPAHHLTHVYRHGELVERLCVVLSGNFPPTDSLITRFLMVLNDEAGFCRLGVKNGPGRPVPPALPAVLPARPLPELYRECKEAPAAPVWSRIGRTLGPVRLAV